MEKDKRCKDLDGTDKTVICEALTNCRKPQGNQQVPDLVRKPSAFKMKDQLR